MQSKEKKKKKEYTPAELKKLGIFVRKKNNEQDAEI